jgi:hypothetical protein
MTLEETLARIRAAGRCFVVLEDMSRGVLTRTWAKEIVIPKPGAKAAISYAYTKKKPPSYEFTSTYEPARARWTVKPSRPRILCALGE